VIVALAGGVGGARLAVGLAAVLRPSELAIVVNTGDDFEHHGLAVSPDLDTVMYTLAGIANTATGWGRADETWNFMTTLGELGGETWFQLGDRDLAVHVLRTEQLRLDVPLSKITRTLTTRLGIAHRLIPMSDTPVRTRVRTRDAELAFQDYFVRMRCKPRVAGFRFAGSRTARVPPELLGIMRKPVRAVVICPSNPYISIAPMLAIREIREWLRRRTFPVVAVSPIVGGAALKGPAAKMMRELGASATAAGVARHYGALVDGWVIDRRDAKLERDIEDIGPSVAITDTLMTSRAKSVALANRVLAFAKSLK
jgi:LPPG:FO 2-phospho-L-lactate transferase